MNGLMGMVPVGEAEHRRQYVSVISEWQAAYLHVSARPSAH